VSVKIDAREGTHGLRIASVLHRAYLPWRWVTLILKHNFSCVSNLCFIEVIIRDPVSSNFPVYSDPFAVDFVSPPYYGYSSKLMSVTVILKSVSPY
jgi:hypothetical protein